MPQENDLLSRCEYIVGKCALFCAFLNDDSTPKHTWFSFDSKVGFGNAVGIGSLRKIWEFLL